MSPGPDLDGGSDLSELSDAGSQPGTPGQALTPQTSPVPQTRRASLRRGTDTTTTTTAAPLATNAEPQKEKNPRRSQRGRDSAVEVTQPKSKEADLSPQTSNGMGNKKATSHPRWEYKQIVDKNIFRDDPVIEGKRTRKSIDRFGSEGAGADNNPPSIRRRSTSSRKSASREPAGESTSAEVGNDSRASPVASFKPEPSEDQQQQPNPTKKTIKIKRKQPKPEVTPEEVTQEAFTEDPEEEQPTRKRRKGSKAELEAVVPDSTPSQRIERVQDEDEEDLPQPRKKKLTRPGKKIKLKRPASQKKKETEPLSDDYEEEAGSDSDVAMSDDADEDALDERKYEERAPRYEHTAAAEKRKATSKPFQRAPSIQKPSKPRSGASSIVPAKDLAASASQLQQPPPAKPITSQAVASSSSFKAALPQRPPVPQKNVIRKSVGSSVLDNLMGFGTPSRSSAPRPRPPQSGATSSPQPQRRPGEPIRPRPPAADPANRAKPGITTSHDPNNLGLNGKHVTAEQMAAKREVEVQQYANPKGLFNLLEGTELMMEFEDETRQRLQIDPFLHKHKLYRPGRTEGMWKLIDRIKETEGMK
ncbi:uncharacterized protein FA14DRAFT_18711 [Meira miltonrushii]|uniref:Uncharacterized protein n=1 Tax=Meira miltonrushii TaxID=1280837 RepID=A0A316VMX7_9BASI|nr:uncharacterized protein FA14DRAFT_18711 [Meira miltonrushii]PWN37753.1 hypothetical protein FA14DRAFT_18711 [Meira miltonrushii]